MQRANAAAGWRMLALLVAVFALAFFDRQILGLIVAPLRASLSISDAEVGLLQGFSIAAPLVVAGLPLGRAIDRLNRRNLLLASVLFWGAMTAACGFATGFWDLFLFRIGVGLGEAGLHPAAYSLLADLFPPERRVRANLIFYVGTLAAASAGIALGGALIDFTAQLAFTGIEPWRLVLIAAALPAPVVAACLALAREPKRRLEPAAVRGDGTLLQLLRAAPRIYGALLLGWATLETATATLAAWTPAILARSFGVAAADAAYWVGASAGISSIAGVATAGLLARNAAAGRNVRAFATIAACGAALCVPVTMLFGAVQSGPAAALLFGLQFFAQFVGAGLVPSIVQEVTPGSLRGRVVALQTIVALAAIAGGSLLAGLMSDRVFAGADGLRQAVVALQVPALLLAAVSFTSLALPRGLPSLRPSS